MGTKLGDLTSAVMSAANNVDAASFINQWANWAISEIWFDRPWPFRVRELPATPIHLNDYKVTLPNNFDLPKEFRIIGPSPTGRKLFRMTDQILRRRVTDPTDVSAADTPKWWLFPIESDTFDVNGNPIFSLRFFPPSDGDYTVGGSFYATHPILGPSDYILIPQQYDYVIVDRLRIYLKEYEDEMDITPWVKKYAADLNSMRNDMGRNLDALPSWKPERFLQQMDIGVAGVGRDIDLGE